MSKLALLRAVRDHLRGTLNIKQDACTITPPGGSPPPHMGRFHVSVHEGTDRISAEAYLHEEMAVDVTITIRTGEIPRDRFESVYESQAGAMEELERKVLTAIHDNQDIRIAACANANLPNSEYGDIFQTPLWAKSRGPLTPRFADWAGDVSEGNESTFITRTINFGECTRIQALDVMH